MIGQTISHYRILEKIGEGGMGVVYRAEDTKLKRIVALKFLTPQMLGSEAEKTRFVHEAQAAAALDHPNICTVHEIDEVEGRTFIAMAYVEGQSLKEKIEVGPLKLNQALDIAIQVAQGLQAAHEKGVVHRDIKSANIIVTQTGQAKIMDFGLAKLPGRTKVTRADMTVGTIAYMSPEQGRGEEVDHRTDIWSLGVVLYEMITGQLPFRSEYEQAVMYSIMNEEPEPITSLRSNIPMELEWIVIKCVEKNPGDRYQHPDELLVDLRHCRKDSEITSKMKLYPSAHRQAPTWSRKRAPIVLLGVILSAAVIALAFWLLQTKFGARHPADKEKSIAVLPFTSLSKSDEDQTFADGIHDEILTQFAKIGQMKVIARTSVLQYRDTKKRMSEIGKELGVSYLVEGTVQKSGGRIRIRAQLIDAQSEDHIWAEAYDRPYADIFVIQANVAKSMASTVGATLTVSEKAAIEAKPTENMQAYDFFLRGMYYWRSEASVEANDKAIAMFEKAVELDPGFAKAQAWIAYIHSGNYDPRWDRSPARREKARKALDKAIAMDPNIAEVHMAAGEYAFLVEGDVEHALAEFEAALAVRPNEAEILSALVFLHYFGFGQPARAIAYGVRRSELDPYALNVDLVTLSFQLMRNWDEAEKWADFMITHHPDYDLGYIAKCYVLLFGRGDIIGARKVYHECRMQATQLLVDRWLEWEMELYARKYGAALDTLMRVAPQRRGLHWFQTWGFSVPDTNTSHDWALARTYSLLREKTKAATYFERARSVAASRVREQPRDKAPHVQLGLAYAGLGQRAEAITEANVARNLASTRSDENGPLSADFGAIMRDVAHIYIMAGEHDSAISILDSLLSVPSVISKARLSLDPMYDPLRSNPRFQALLARPEETQ